MSPAAVPSGLSLLDPAFERWDLTPDGTPFTTPSSLLAPVRRADGTPAMLKRALVAEEERGNRVMVWWSGAGSCWQRRCFEHDDSTILLERATGQRSLAAMAEGERATTRPPASCARPLLDFTRRRFRRRSRVRRV